MQYGKKHGVYLKTPLDWAKCGTLANHRAHLRRGEKPCEACRQAHNRIQRSRPTPKCRHCDKRTQLRGLCCAHLKEEYGITLADYNRMRRRGINVTALLDALADKSLHELFRLKIA